MKCVPRIKKLSIDLPICTQNDDVKIRWAEQCPAMANGLLTSIAGTPSMSPGSAVASYGLVAVTERFDESLVVLRHVLGLELEELLYVSAKTNESDSVWSKVSPECTRTLLCFIAEAQTAESTQSKVKAWNAPEGCCASVPKPRQRRASSQNVKARNVDMIKDIDVGLMCWNATTQFVVTTREYVLMTRDRKTQWSGWLL